MTDEKKNAPIQTLKEGAVRVKIWEQDSKKGKFPTMTIGRIYKDLKTGEFRESKSLSRAHLEDLHKLLPRALEEEQHWQQYYDELAMKNDVARDEAAPAAKEEKPAPDLAKERDAFLAKAKTPTSEKAKGREAAREPDAR